MPAEQYEDRRPPGPPLRRRLGRYAHERPVRFSIGLALLAAALAGGFLFWRHLQSSVSTDDAEVGGHLVPLSSRIDGTVVAVHVENNRTVARGQTLVELDRRDYEVAVNQARAALDEAQAQLAAAHPTVTITATSNASGIATARAAVAGAEASLAAARRDLDSAIADVRQAEADSLQAQADEARYRALVQKDEVSAEEYGQRQATAQADRALVEARRATAKAARRAVAEQEARLAQTRARLAEVIRNGPSELSIRRATVASRRAAVEAARARLEHAELDLSYCTITAPVAGIVGDESVQVGERVQPGEPLLTITATGDVWVTANFKETQIARMRPGQPASIHVDALDQDFNGHVENLPGATGAKYSVLPPENATGNYVKVVQRLPVRLRFEPGQPGLERLRPGMSVEPTVRIQ